MKKLLIILIFIIPISLSAREKKPGYLIWSYGGNYSNVYKSETLTKAQVLFDAKYPNIKVDIEKQLHDNPPVFQVMSKSKGFYVEKVWLIYKRNGKIRIRKLR